MEIREVFSQGTSAGGVVGGGCGEAVPGQSGLLQPHRDGLLQEHTECFGVVGLGRGLWVVAVGDVETKKYSRKSKGGLMTCQHCSAKIDNQHQYEDVYNSEHKYGVCLHGHTSHYVEPQENRNN